MPVTVDIGAGRADNLVWRDRASLTELVPGVRFQAPEAFVEGSLAVYLNGQTLDRWSDNGFTVLSPTEFELRESIEALGVRARLFVSYLTA